MTHNFFIEDNKTKNITKFDITEFKTGESLYEVVKVINSRGLFLENHISRLFETAKISNKKLWLS